jgi:hypothetical protein
VESVRRDDPVKLEKDWNIGAALSNCRLKSETHWINGCILSRVTEKKTL